MNKGFLPTMVIALSAFFAIFAATPGYACDFTVCKYEDANGNGIQDLGEPNIPGWLIRIYDDLSSGPIVEGTTGSDGCIFFHLAVAGPIYKVWEEQVACWEATAPESVFIANGGYYVEVPTFQGSSHLINFGNMYVCNGGGEGCTPGYWKNHEEDWGATAYSLGDDFDSIFGVDLFDPDITLEMAVHMGGGGVKKLARHGTAALLSAAHPDVDYPYSVADVIAIVQAGDVDLLVDANELGCIIP